MWRVYRYDLPALIRQQGPAIVSVCIALALAVGVSVRFSHIYRLPSQLFDFSGLPAQAFEELPELNFLPPLTTWGIFWNNVRALLLAGVASLISFGALAILLLMVPVAIIAYVGAGVVMAGQNLGQFLVAFVLPHGIIELPAAILATAFAVKMGAVMVARPEGGSVGVKVLESLADFVKLFLFLVLPMLLLAAFIEAHFTLQIALRTYGLGSP